MFWHGTDVLCMLTHDYEGHVSLLYKVQTFYSVWSRFYEKVKILNVSGMSCRHPDCGGILMRSIIYDKLINVAENYASPVNFVEDFNVLAVICSILSVVHQNPTYSESHISGK